MKSIIKIFIVFISIIHLSSCDNNEKLKQSREQESIETQEIDKIRNDRKVEIDSLQSEITKLKNKKHSLISQNKIDYLKAEIYYTLKKSNFDHIIIGTKNLAELTDLFKLELGFTIKKGKSHKNGIKNNFIEFLNDSEIELIEVTQPLDKLSQEYKTLINNQTRGLLFSIRVNEIKKLRDNFNQLQSAFSNFESNPTYSTLSAQKINSESPFFFIEYRGENSNSLISHKNNSKGISAVWYSSSDIKTTARELIDFGFSLIDNYSIPSFKGKVLKFKNDNFAIILIESNKAEIKGLTILTKDLKSVKNILHHSFGNNFIEQISGRGKSIFVSENLTKSIWLEFLELQN